MNESQSKWIIHTKKKNGKMKRLVIFQYFSCTSFKKGMKHNGDFLKRKHSFLLLRPIKNEELQHIQNKIRRLYTLQKDVEWVNE